MVTARKVGLEDSLNGIIWHYLQNDFKLHVVAHEVLNHENAAKVLAAGYTLEEYIESGAYMIRNYIAMNLMIGSNNSLYSDIYESLLDAINFEALAKKFFEEIA